MNAGTANLTSLRNEQARLIVSDCARDLARLRSPSSTRVEALRELYFGACAALPSGAMPIARMYCSLLCDLRAQGWSIGVKGSELRLTAPEPNEESADLRKAQVRNGLLLERDSQLAQAPTRRFIREMEQRRRHGQAWHSVASLMRDGRELANSLRAIATLSTDEARLQALRRVIDPYVEVADSDSICSITGLRLIDIWRYFRHTWTTPYFSTPGRRMLFLVRDRAAHNHPVIGIGALGSAIIQLAPRDAWIGWTAEQLWARLRERPTVTWGKWLHRSIGHLLEGIYTKDLITKGIITRAAMRQPTSADIARLRKRAAKERRLHHLYPKRNLHKTTTMSSAKTDWRAQAETHLFRAKRAGTLADLLEARRRLLDAGLRKPTAEDMKKLVSSVGAKQAVSTILRQVKATHAGVDMMEITICGAIAPYNAILGGKLVSLLMASPQVRDAYAKRYAAAVSVIASSMAGRAVTRRPNLVLLGTTSLYDIAPAQYNRLRMPAERAGGLPGEKLAFMPIGRTAGYGSYHFSRSTMALIELVLARRRSGRPVNSIFGEGVNPKLRKVRSALDMLGLPTDELLQHSSPRLIFAVPLASNFRDVLIGVATRPKMILPSTTEATTAIVDFWRERWLAGRIERDGVLPDVERHRCSYPLRHGARVSLPSRTGAAMALGSLETPLLLETESDEEAELVIAGAGRPDE
jgi:hypothetical protein